ncbi:MAG: BLUF domain-containing protein [Opitutales bacterium]
MSNLHQVIYISMATKMMSTQDMQRLLHQATTNNNKTGITGILLYRSGLFMQYLEGTKNVVQSLYTKIKNDRRHTSLIKMHDKPISERVFKNWAMEFRHLKNINSLLSFDAYLRSHIDDNAKECNRRAVYNFIMSFDQRN